MAWRTTATCSCSHTMMQGCEHGSHAHRCGTRRAALTSRPKHTWPTAWPCPDRRRGSMGLAQLGPGRQPQTAAPKAATTGWKHTATQTSAPSCRRGLSWALLMRKQTRNCSRSTACLGAACAATLTAGALENLPRVTYRTIPRQHLRGPTNSMHASLTSCTRRSPASPNLLGRGHNSNIMVSGLVDSLRKARADVAQPSRTHPRPRR